VGSVRGMKNGSSEMAPGNLTVAVLSGKGGVGKTTLSVNLAIAMANASPRKILLFDGDSGLANAHILMGVKPARTLANLVSGEMPLADVVEQTPWKVDMVAGSNGSHELLADGDQHRQRAAAELAELLERYDIVVIDCPAGADDTALHYAHSADVVLVVLTGEPTSFLDAYSTVKELNATYKRQRFDLVVNVVASEAEGKQLFARFQSVTSRFLDVELRYLGAVRRDTAVNDAIRRCVPVVRHDPASRASRDIAAVAARLARYTETARDPHAIPTRNELAAELAMGGHP
jgi:flagellar biosynthesis protein FlhG